MGEKGANSTMKFIELSQQQQRIVFTQVSVQTGINVNLAEKDWWICQVLSALYKLPSAEQIRDLQIRNKKGKGDVLIPK